MAQTAELDVHSNSAPDTIEATLNYIVNDGAKSSPRPAGRAARPAQRRHDRSAPGGHPQRAACTRRSSSSSATASASSATTPRSPTSSTRPRCERVYYPEMEALVKAESGATRVVVFDHTLRTADDAMRESARSARSCRACTTTTPNGRGRSACATSCPTKPTSCSSAASPSSRCGGRSAIRSRRSPLAICDARSVSFDDLVISERRYPNRVGQTYAIIYNPNHKWFWFPRMRRDEAMVFKVFDSAKDGRARWTAHTAFDDPTSPPNARPRESIEIRTLAFF